MCRLLFSVNSAFMVRREEAGTHARIDHAWENKLFSPTESRCIKLPFLAHGLYGAAGQASAMRPPIVGAYSRLLELQTRNGVEDHQNSTKEHSHLRLNLPWNH